MFGLGTPELIVIGVIVIVLFGAKRIPEIGKGLGGAIREFRHAKKDFSPPATPRGNEQEPDRHGSLERQIMQKVAPRVPAVKETLQAMDKVDKIKKLIKS